MKLIYVFILFLVNVWVLIVLCDEYILVVVVDVVIVGGVIDIIVVFGGDYMEKISFVVLFDGIDCGVVFLKGCV